LSRSTFFLRKTDAVSFVPHETNGTQKTHLCDKCAPIKSFKGQESTFVSGFLRDKKAHLSPVIFYELFVIYFLTANLYFRIEVRCLTSIMSSVFKNRFANAFLWNVKPKSHSGTINYNISYSRNLNGWTWRRTMKHTESRSRWYNDENSTIINTR
jgi:hypothetical protein